MKNNDCSCKGCTERFVGCHATCDKYLEWKEKHEAERLMIQEIKDKERKDREYVKKSIERMSRNRFKFQSK